MSRYGDSRTDSAKENLYYEMEYATNEGCTLEDILYVFNDFMQYKISSLKKDIETELEEKYKGYKEKCEAMEKILGK